MRNGSVDRDAEIKSNRMLKNARETKAKRNHMKKIQIFH